MSEISPTARALRTLEILRDRPGATADELAQRIGVAGNRVPLTSRYRFAFVRSSPDFIPLTGTRSPSRPAALLNPSVA